MSLQTFNYIEAALWFAVSLSLCPAFFSKHKPRAIRMNAVVAAIAFFGFGVSDIIEAHTGSWWQPPGLLILNISCVLVLIICYIRHRKLKNPG